MTDKETTGGEQPASPVYHVAPSPHVSDTTITTRRMMRDVLYALIPGILVWIWIFRWGAVTQIGLTVVFCMGWEWVFSRMRGREAPLGDLSAVITGVILGMSLPASAPFYIPLIGAAAAIGLSKAAFGGLGFNLFNPAMVGRAFVMLSFANSLGAGAYLKAGAHLDAITGATPLTAAKEVAGSALPALLPLLAGNVSRAVDEISAVALLAGGIYLCLRRSASWEIPAGTLLAAYIVALAARFMGLTSMGALEHLISGALMFGAFFIATDPVTSPLTPKGKVIFGAGFGALTMILRLFSSYPEGVMFAVLLMNATVPLINRWTVPRPLGGMVPVPAAGGK